MIRCSTVSTIQACAAVVRMSGMSAFRRRTLHASRVIAHEVDQDKKICAARRYLGRCLEIFRALRGNALLPINCGS
jgi:hypothetical protein